MWGLHSYPALLLQHHSGPAPLHALRDLGGGLQPAGAGCLWCHHPRHPRRGWVWEEVNFDPFLELPFFLELRSQYQWALRLQSRTVDTSLLGSWPFKKTKLPNITGYTCLQSVSSSTCEGFRDFPLLESLFFNQIPISVAKVVSSLGLHIVKVSISSKPHCINATGKGSKHKNLQITGKQ